MAFIHLAGRTIHPDAIQAVEWGEQECIVTLAATEGGRPVRITLTGDDRATLARALGYGQPPAAPAPVRDASQKRPTRPKP